MVVLGTKAKKNVFTAQGVNTLRNLKEGTRGWVKLILTFMIPDVISTTDRDLGWERCLLTRPQLTCTDLTLDCHEVCCSPGDPACPSTKRVPAPSSPNGKQQSEEALPF